MSELRIEISPMLLKSVASLYSDPHRVLMEYIDNAIDAAEAFFDTSTNTYTKQIEINVVFDGQKHDYARITIDDNCTGIEDLSELVTKVGNSSKIRDDRTNGQFGFGIYSFLAICDTMVIISRTEGSDTYNRVELNSKMFENADSEKSGIIEKPGQKQSIWSVSDAKEHWFTKFKLEGFSKQAFSEISIKTLRAEIENHFELILSRKNISISITGNDKYTYKCKPFDYTHGDGELFFREINSLDIIKSRKHRTKSILTIPDKITVNLKVYKNKMLGRKPVFVNKGRRITEISNVKAFRTNSKSSIWSHPGITGYVDISGILEPNISRSDFKPNIYTKALFKKLIELESEIKIIVDRQFKSIQIKEFKNLEALLSKALNKLHKNENLKRLLNISTKNGSLIRKNNKLVITLLAPVKYYGDSGIRTEHKRETDADIISLITKPHNTNYEIGDTCLTDRNNGNVTLKNKKIKIDALEDPDSDRFKNKERNEFGLNIVIDGENEPPLDSENNKIRSSMIGNNIIIYRNHPMFEERIKKSDTADEVITGELIFYITVEIITRLKVFAYNENKDDIGDIESFFNYFNEGLYLFADEFSSLNGKQLSELTGSKKV